jgi:hypothetical protein
VFGRFDLALFPVNGLCVRPANGMQVVGAQRTRPPPRRFTNVRKIGAQEVDQLWVTACR